MEIAPSIIAGDFSRLREEIRSIEESGIRILHLDVMDGHFVPNFTFGILIVESIRRMTSLELDTHLMMTNPSEYLEKFYEAGADILTVHIETGLEAFRSIEIAGRLGKRIGLAINPPVHPRVLLPHLEDIHQVIVMTVNPGFAGQKMIEDALYKVEFLLNEREKKGLNFRISVDGGVKREHLPMLRDMGVDVAVMGSGFFKLPPEGRRTLLEFL